MLLSHGLSIDVMQLDIDLFWESWDDPPELSLPDPVHAH